MSAVYWCRTELWVFIVGPSGVDQPLVYSCHHSQGGQKYCVGNLLWYLKVGRLLMSDTTFVRHLVSVRPNHRAIVVGLPVVDTPVPFNQANL
jgi:hypothetical protein